MIFAITTVFFPTKENVKNIELISEQVDFIFICDNSDKSYLELFVHINNLKYYFFPENFGLSIAFNRVLTDVNNSFSNQDYILFFDQDSTIGPNHVRNMLNDYFSIASEGIKVGCLGPIYFENNSNKLKIQNLKKELIPSIYSVKSIITSSMMCQYGNLLKIGFWNESVFLDMADWDLCWRFIQAGYLCCITKNIVLSHSLGENIKRVGCMNFKVGKTFRNYYQVRECLFLLGKEYTPFKFKVRFLISLLIRNPLRLLCLNNKREQLFYMKKGFQDWKKHNAGPIVDYYRE